MSTPLRNVAVLAVIVIVGLGAYWLGRQEGETSALSAKLAGMATPPETARLQEENARLAAENERLAKQATSQETPATAPPQDTAIASAAASPSTLDRLHTLAELQQKNLANVRVTTVDQNGRVPNSFAELFGLSPAEKNTLQQAVDQARQQVDQITASSALMSRRPDGSVVISVPSFETGSAIRDTLMNTFAQTLGPERNEAFLALDAPGPPSQPGQLASALNGFGAEERTITVARRAPSAENPSTISVQDMHRTGIGATHSFGTSVSDTARLPGNLRWIVPLIPADF